MNKVAVLNVLLLILCCCGEKEINPGKPVTSLLPGVWESTNPCKESNISGCYSRIFRTVDLHTQEALWIDTIEFQAVTFEFSEYNDTAFTNSFKISSANSRELYGNWTINATHDTLTIFSVINTYMTEDTLINDHRYTFSDFIRITFTITEASDSQLKLASGDQSLTFTKN